MTKKKPAVRTPRKKWKVEIWRKTTVGELYAFRTFRFTDPEWNAFASGIGVVSQQWMANGFADYQESIGCYLTIAGKVENEVLIRTAL